MANSLFKALNGNTQGAKPNMAQALLQHINGFRGDPREVLKNKINSGEISQDQYNQMRGIAEEIARKMAAVLPRR